MTTKNPLLLELDMIVYTLLSDIYKSQSKMCEIKHQLLNYEFEEDELIYKKILDFVDGEHIQKIKRKLSKYVNEIERAANLDDDNENVCRDHQWVTDLIDITPDTSQTICYCLKCEATK